MTEKRLREIEARLAEWESQGKQPEFIDGGNIEDLRDLLAALREPGIRIPLDMARETCGLLENLTQLLADEAAWAIRARGLSAELSRLIREEEERGG